MIGVIELNGFSCISGLFHSLESHLVGCFQGIEKYNTEGESDVISTSRMTKLSLFSVE